MLVIERLVFLGVIALFGVRGMESGIRVRAVLTEADHARGVFGVVFVKELIGLLKLAEIPAKVEVVAVDVGDLEDRAVDLQHKHIGHRCQTGLVHAVAELIEQPMVFEQLLVHGAGGCNLVREAPDRNAGVVVALGDQLAHLVERVLPPIRHMHRDIGDLGPDDDAVFVAEVIKLLRVLVVGQAQRVRAKLADDGHIGLVILVRQGVALALEILMAADAAQRIAAAVEEEALFGSQRKTRQPKRVLTSSPEGSFAVAV